MKSIDAVHQDALRRDLPPFRAGDTVRVHVRIREGDKERVQIFEGVVIQRRGGGAVETFTVRKVSSGVGVERIFPVHAKNYHFGFNLLRHLKNINISPTG